MGILFVLVIDLFFAFATGLIAKYKGRNYILWGIIGLFTTFIGLIVVMFVGKVNINDNENQQNITSDSENDISTISESQAKENDVNDKRKKSSVSFKFIWIMAGVILFIAIAIIGIIQGVLYKMGIRANVLNDLSVFCMNILMFIIFVPIVWVIIKVIISLLLDATSDNAKSSKYNVVEKTGEPIKIEHWGENGLLVCDYKGPIYTWHINHLIADTVVLDPIEYKGKFVTIEDIRDGKFIIYLTKSHTEVKKGSKIDNYWSWIFGPSGCQVNRFKRQDTIVI